MEDALKIWLVDAAGALGVHAPQAYGVALVLLLAATALLWRVWQRAAPRLPQPARLPLPALLALYLGAGFVVIAAAAAVFAEMAEAMEGGETLGQVDEALTASLRQSLSPTVLRFFALLTRLGDGTTLVVLALVVAALLWWRGRRWLALGWSLALAGNALLNPLLKAVFERVRPVHEHEFALATGYSFPSGHSSGALVSYGMVAYLLLRLSPPRWHLMVLMAAVVLVFSIGCSRVFLQVHYASDVLAGFASGAAWLAVCVTAIEALRGTRGLPRNR